MKRYFSGLFALLLVAVIALTGCSSEPGALSGDYRQDTLAVINTLRSAIELPSDAPEKPEVQADARKKINDFAARYQRNGSVANLSSFTTMRTALNSLAAHYSYYPNRPIPDKLKNRLEEEFARVERALQRGA